MRLIDIKEDRCLIVIEDLILEQVKFILEKPLSTTLLLEPWPNATDNSTNSVQLSCSANVHRVWLPFSMVNFMLGNARRYSKIV